MVENIKYIAILPATLMMYKLPCVFVNRKYFYARIMIHLPNGLSNNVILFKPVFRVHVLGKDVVFHKVQDLRYDILIVSILVSTCQ